MSRGNNEVKFCTIEYDEFFVCDELSQFRCSTSSPSLLLSIYGSQEIHLALIFIHNIDLKRDY